jgi:tetrahydromethanopterin S-methyltransferase subunit G
VISRRRSLSFSHLLQNVETVVGRIADLLGAAVVGLIVLVVLTLVLAAVVGTFVLDAGADVENNV